LKRFVKRKFTVGKLNQISEFERFYFEAKRIQAELDLLIKDMQTIIFKNEDLKPNKPVVIDPRTGQPF
jgi:hypothetical protein